MAWVEIPAKVFDELTAHSKKTHQQFKALELELEGLEDILPYTDERTASEIRERVYRIRNILKE